MASNPVSDDDPAYIGNELFVQKKFDQALEAYSTAIEKFPDMVKLYSNRALTYLKMNRPYEALKDIEIGLKIEPIDEKLNYRKCTALLEMRRFREASEFLDDALKRMQRFPEKYGNEFRTLIDDMNRLKTEYADGQFDIMAMIEEAKTSPILVKHADYYAWSKFEIREVDGKGRGLVAKEKIELGELLIACEAFAFVPIMIPGTFASVTEQVRKKLTNRPDLAEQFYRLYAGPRLGHLENWTEGGGGSELIDMERIKGVLRYNYYGDSNVLFLGTVGASDRHAGVALIPSYINHTCIDFNCARYFVGNYTFVRATKAIEIGEELVFPYVCAAFDVRQRDFERGQFECRCRLCQIERQHSIEVKNRLTQIYQFLNGLEVRAGTTGVTATYDIPILKRFVEELRQYRPGLSLDYLAVCVRQALALCESYFDPEASVRMFKELIEYLKSGGDYVEALYTTKGLKHAAIQSGNQREEDECKQLARGIAKMFFDDERVADLHV